jgi:hypothetical protein
MVWILSAPLNGLDRGTTLVVSTFAAYLGVFLALPVYLYLQMREAMTFWLAPIVGFTMGVTTTYVVYFLFGYTSLGALLIPSFFEMRTGLAARPGPLLERYFG